MVAPRWLAPCRIEVTPRILGGEKLVVANRSGFTVHCGTGLPNQCIQRTFGCLDDAATTAEYDCRVWRSDNNVAYPRGPAQLEWKGTVALPITLVSAAEEVMEAVTDEQFPKPLREFVNLNVAFIGGKTDDEALLGVRVLLDRTQSPELDGLALGLSVDLVWNGAVLASEPMPPMKLTMNGKIDCGTTSYVGLAVKEWSAAAEAGAILRFRSNTEMALRDLDCSKYWSGQFEAALAEIANYGD